MVETGRVAKAASDKAYERFPVRDWGPLKGFNIAFNEPECFNVHNGTSLASIRLFVIQKMLQIERSKPLCLLNSLISTEPWEFFLLASLQNETIFDKLRYFLRFFSRNTVFFLRPPNSLVVVKSQLSRVNAKKCFDDKDGNNNIWVMLIWTAFN